MEQKKATIPVRTIVCHTQESFTAVHQKGFLVFEFAPHISVFAVRWIDGFTTSSIGFREIASLDTHSWYNAVDFAIAIAQIFHRPALSFFARTKASEIFTSQRRLVFEEVHYHSSNRPTIHAEVHEALRPLPRRGKHAIFSRNIFLLQLSKQQLLFPSVRRERLVHTVDFVRVV